MLDWIPLFMFLLTFAALLSGYPVAFSLSGSALIFALIGYLMGEFDPEFLNFLPGRVFGVMVNETLIAIPLFIFMGVMLERSKISEDLLDTMSKLFGGLRGGLGISVCLVGGLLAASTGIVGATVVTMGLISLPTMLKREYSPQLSTGIICASGTLGQIIPPSIVLIILGDIIGSEYQKAQLELGNFAPKSISVGDLFLGSIVPGAGLMLCYISFIVALSFIKPSACPALPKHEQPEILSPQFIKKIFKVLLPPLLLVVGVLGSIFMGYATPTEAASVGAVGAMALAFTKKALNLSTLKHVMQETTKINAMVFSILIGATFFSLVFRAYDGDEAVTHWLQLFGNDIFWTFFLVMLVMFVLGFFLDFFEICFVVVPIVAPTLMKMGLDPVWLGVMIAINLQTSFLSPPFGFSLFYLRGVAPKEIKTTQIYKGVLPFIAIQLLMLMILWFFPDLVTFLPNLIYGEG